MAGKEFNENYLCGHKILEECECGKENVEF
jgi:hypothetical protein